ncbi:unnamed protein product (macronuclear) [Paramecium tetraurelia]|uniref:Transmembrane protein n=1 Tax=Paramecium tetraurelia TaxID=5888 RepID=A0DCL6_PARTE|nr:uncharacterized protein GSPATT00015662001 [Paramecium tetraurelia]CAK80783.1 unnamed protein product [Paramecium tetraurelia]|eukprot:XP_001448180.1 hypothetical protein (macronuclear) [Paramecium tetraurelia strain d4-2]
MNQLQLSQAQSPRESNFDYDEQPQTQSIQLIENRAALSFITNVFKLIQRIQIQILVAIFQILLILFNSYIAFDLSYKISLLYVTILHFLQIIRIGVNNNKQNFTIHLFRKIQNTQYCCIQIFWGVLSISYYVLYSFSFQGMLDLFLREQRFSDSVPNINVFDFHSYLVCSDTKQLFKKQK